jgi:predicted DNA-binding ribbon-helix-helix protein
LAFFLDLKEIGKKKDRSLPEMILPEEYQKNSKGDKKNAASAMRLILNNPDDCLFIIGKF